MAAVRTVAKLERIYGDASAVAEPLAERLGDGLVHDPIGIAQRAGNGLDRAGVMREGRRLQHGALKARRSCTGVL